MVHRRGERDVAGGRIDVAAGVLPMLDLASEPLSVGGAGERAGSDLPRRISPVDLVRHAVLSLALLDPGHAPSPMICYSYAARDGWRLGTGHRDRALTWAFRWALEDLNL